MDKKFAWVNITHARKLAKIMDWKFLDKTFEGVKHKHKWKCEKGHTFEMRYANIYFRGNFCPTCRTKIKPEELDYKNKNNRYEQNKKKIHREWSKRGKKKKGKHFEIVQLLRKSDLPVKYSATSHSHKKGKWIIVGDGIKEDGILDFVSRNTYIHNKSALGDRIKKILKK